MASENRIYPVSNPPSIIHHHHQHPPLHSSSYPLSGCSSSMFNFEDRSNPRKNKRSLFQSFEHEDCSNEDEHEYDEYYNYNPSGKKRRLSLDQLNLLEKSFELDNKLEPDRKLQLSKDLALHPRQVAIWFQNRRARWKTKQMEKDYDVLQQSFDSLKASYDILCQEKEHLKSQIAILGAEFALKHKGKADTSVEPSQASAVASQHEYSTSPGKMDNGIFDSYSTSAKEDMFETDSHCYINCMHSPHLEHVDSSYMLEHENSDLSQDEDDTTCFFPSTPYRLLPKLESVDYSSASGNFSLPAFWSWSF